MLEFRSRSSKGSDIAISFKARNKPDDGLQDERIATALAECLTEAAKFTDLNYLFDKPDQYNFVARDLEESLSAKFSTDTHLVMSLCSDAYFGSKYCQIEFKAAQDQRNRLASQLYPMYPNMGNHVFFHFLMRSSACPLTGEHKKAVERIGIADLKNPFTVANFIVSSIGNISWGKHYHDEFLWSPNRATIVAENLSKNKCVTILGPSGAGKTRFATELALEIRPAFFDGVWFLGINEALSNAQDPAVVVLFESLCKLMFRDFVPVSKSDEIEPKWLRLAKKIKERLNKAEPKARDRWNMEHERNLAHCIKQLREWQKEGSDSPQALVVLDNAETAKFAVAELAKELTYQANVRILITSQASIGISGAHLKYNGLDIQSDEDRTDLSLLIQKRRDSIEPADDGDMIAFLAENDYNAMLLELLCAATRERPFADVKAKLDTLHVPSVSVDPRLWSLFKMFEYQYLQLSPQAQMLLRLVGYADAGLTQEFLDWLKKPSDKAQTLCHELGIDPSTLEEDIDRLIESRMLVESTGRKAKDPSRILIAREAVHQYLKTKQSAKEKLSFLRLLAYFSENIEVLSGGDGVNSIPPSYLPAWRKQWPLVQIVLNTATPASLSYGEFSSFLNRANGYIFSEGQTQATLKAIDRYLKSDGISSADRLDLSGYRFALLVEEYLPFNFDWVRQSFAEAKAIGDYAMMMSFAATAGVRAFSKGTDKVILLANELCDQCFAGINLSSTSKPDQAAFYEGVSMLRYKEGNFVESEKHAQTAYDLYAELGQRHQVWNCLNTLGLSEVEVGQHKEAQKHLEEIVGYATDEDYPFWKRVGIWNIGYMFSRVGRYDEAWERFEKVLQWSFEEQPDIDHDSLDYYSVLAAAKQRLDLAKEFRALANAYRKNSNTQQRPWERKAYVDALSLASPDLALHEAKNVRSFDREVKAIFDGFMEQIGESEDGDLWISQESLKRIAELRVLFSAKSNK